MNLKSILKIVLPLLGLCCLITYFAMPKEATYEKSEEKINLAIRQMAHHLYKAADDNKSRILPVEKVSENKYTLEMSSKVNYDTMPFLLDRAMVDYEIESNYYVLISECGQDNVLLGFNNIDVKDNAIPCRGRDLPGSECNLFTLNFMEEEVLSYSWLLFLGIPMLLGGFFLALVRPSQSKELPIEKDSEEKVKKVGQAVFDDSNLIYIHGGASKKLTFREAKLLTYFLENENQILKREDIQDNVWEDNVIVGRSLDVFISRLRKIIKEDNSISIDNIHGVGYKMVVNK